MIQLPWLGHGPWEGRLRYDIDIQAGLLLRTDHWAAYIVAKRQTNGRAACMCSFHFFLVAKNISLHPLPENKLNMDLTSTIGNTSTTKEVF
jgi:hypothetical protein